MQLNILIISVLFPTISLMMINFVTHWELLAKLIHNLHETVISKKILIDDSARFFYQIASLRQRLQLIAIIQTCITCIYPIWKNIKNGRIIWQHQNHVVKNRVKPCYRHHLRRIQLADIPDYQHVGLFLIVFTLQIANDCKRIFFSNIQSLAQIIDFFTFITSNNAITKR